MVPASDPVGHIMHNHTETPKTTFLIFQDCLKKRAKDDLVLIFQDCLKKRAKDDLV